ncbi:MAG TPA: NAD-dependent malic enzyme [Gaiellaceae bacterium]|jgi:malate dehydrogenase (oxaloacetate-decarboxylating)
MSALHPSASFSATLRVRLENRPGTFARLAEAIGEAGGLLGAIDLVRVERGTKVRDVTVLAGDAEHLERIAAAVRAVPGIEVVNVSDRTFLMHLGGKIEVALKSPLKTRDDLSMAYTPGVARVSSAIAADPAKAWNLTIKQNTVAVVSDGTAVLGLGDVGPEAALPVMEGKAMLFKEFGGVDAFPICLATTDPDEIVATVKAIAPVFGGVNLEDISAPRCFEIEDRLRDELDIPVFHDDQHGTAIVTLAALHNAVKVVGKRLEELRVVVTGVGAAGVAVTRMLLAAGVADVVGCDRKGVVYAGRPELTPAKAGLAEVTNPRGVRGSADEALAGADVFVGLSRPGAVTAEGIRSMADGAIVFAMANPTPEVLPEEIADVAAVIGTGRSDYPNQINNVLAFPGVFRGALDVRATAITEGMELAAAEAIAAAVQPEELEPDYVIPSVFNRDVAPAVAAAVARAAEAAGVARRPAGG